MKYTKKATYALLAFLMAAQVVACGSDADNAKETANPGDTTASVQGELDSAAQQKKDFFDAMTSYPAQNGETMEIHFLSDTGDVYVEAEDGEKFNDAQYRRNMEMEEKLGYKIIQTESGDPEIIDVVRNAVASGDTSYDVICSMTRLLGMMFKAGHLQDLNDLENVDFSNPWWNQASNDNLTFGDVRYCAISSLCHMTATTAELVLMNKVIAENLDIEVPYQAVRDGKWTYDMMNEMMAQLPTDSNGDGKMDYNDMVGLVSQHSDVNAVAIACGMDFFDKDDNDILRFILDNPENTDKFSMIYEFYRNPKVASVGLNMDTDWTYWGEKFIDGEALFMLNFPTNLSANTDMKDDFAVLPMPKYDEAQENYRTMTSIYYTSALALPRVHGASENDIGNCIEALSFLSYVDVEPLFAQTYLENRYIRDSESVEMMNLAISSVYHDPGFAIGESLGGAFSIPESVAKKNSNTFASDVASKATAIKKAIEQVADILEDYE